MISAARTGPCQSWRQRHRSCLSRSGSRNCSEPCPSRARSMPSPCPPYARSAPTAAMLRMTRPLCHLLLLLLAVAAFGTDAAALNRMNYPDLLNSSRTKRDVYNVCPPGTYFAKYCEDPEGCSNCLPCKDNEYMERPNYGDSCYECLKCREDQVELSPCQTTRNRECVCKEGTFCDPSQPCEMCQKCRSQCPKGQEVLSPCRPDKDTQCGPATNNSSFSYHWIILIMALVAVALLVCCIWKCRCCCPGDEGNPITKSCGVMNYVMQKLMWCQRVSVGTQDNERNEQRSHDQLVPDAAEPEGHERDPQAEVMLPSARPRRSLIPPEGRKPDLALRDTFDTFAEQLDFDYWRKFGRNLDMGVNDLPQQRDDEELYKMLQKWHQKMGSDASVNMLLETLDQLDLRGVADIISDELRSKGWNEATGEASNGHAVP
ncbi:tumor necrosis factor receptor superfamily member 10A-like [Pithys albifrons albifrons]|uniref:tumor necrosis factor receptor superfamily member 10A-like n=1 Tax=Pithys albifrons albifrons TaxID=3385563 RepID=UPI003A5D1C7C